MHNVPPYIETWSGRKVHLLDPQPEEIYIYDIAYSLGMQCRFTGHTSHFYSVAEHSVLVSHLVPEKLALDGLLHDAAEAYLSDLASPLKRLLPQYYELEDRFVKVIADKFNLHNPMPKEVKSADNAALILEADQLLITKGKDWKHHYPTTIEVPTQFRRLSCIEPKHAGNYFMNRFLEITYGDKLYAGE